VGVAGLGHERRRPQGGRGIPPLSVSSPTTVPLPQVPYTPASSASTLQYPMSLTLPRSQEQLRERNDWLESRFRELQREVSAEKDHKARRVYLEQRVHDLEVEIKVLRSLITEPRDLPKSVSKKRKSSTSDESAEAMSGHSSSTSELRSKQPRLSQFQ